MKFIIPIALMIHLSWNSFSQNCKAYIIKNKISVIYWNCTDTNIWVPSLDLRYLVEMENAEKSSTIRHSRDTLIFDVSVPLNPYSVIKVSSCGKNDNIIAFDFDIKDLDFDLLMPGCSRVYSFVLSSQKSKCPNFIKIITGENEYFMKINKSRKARHRDLCK